MRPQHLLNRKFIYHYPLFSNGPNPGDINPDWREHPEKIQETSKGIRWDRSVFYLWFSYVLRNEEFERYCTDKAWNHREFYEFHEDWGNVFEWRDDFCHWFFRIGGELFAEPRLDLETLVRDAGIFKRTNEVIFLEVPIHNPRKVLLQQITKIIDDEQKKRKPSTGKLESRAKYRIHANPNVDALIRVIAVCFTPCSYKSKGTIARFWASWKTLLDG